MVFQLTRYRVFRRLGTRELLVKKKTLLLQYQWRQGKCLTDQQGKSISGEEATQSREEVSRSVTLQIHIYLPGHLFIPSWRHRPGFWHTILGHQIPYFCRRLPILLSVIATPTSYCSDAGVPFEGHTLEGHLIFLPPVIHPMFSLETSHNYHTWHLFLAYNPPE